MTPANENLFRIFAHGDGFDVDLYLSKSTLHPDQVWRRRRWGLSSGVVLTLGDGLSLCLDDQQQIAVAYLKAHRDELRALAQFDGTETFILGLQYVSKVAENVVGFCLSPSCELMWHALDVGICPVFYVTLERDDLNLSDQE